VDTASVAGVSSAALFVVVAVYALLHARNVSRRRRAGAASARSGDDTLFVRRALIQALLANATAQDAGRADKVGMEASFVLAQLSVTRAPVPEAIHTALSFWSGWIDARQRGWLADTAVFERGAWPALARGVASDLAKNVEIHDPAVLEHFAGRRVRPYARMV
jgi:hypothetical protein